MPIVESDPWRTQYFAAVSCPDNVVIPTDDQLAYQLFPQHRWIYNKLLICETQGLENAPHDIMPRQFPVSASRSTTCAARAAAGKSFKRPKQFRPRYHPG